MRHGTNVTYDYHSQMNSIMSTLQLYFILWALGAHRVGCGLWVAGCGLWVGFCCPPMQLASHFDDQ